MGNTTTLKCRAVGIYFKLLMTVPCQRICVIHSIVWSLADVVSIFILLITA